MTAASLRGRVGLARTLTVVILATIAMNVAGDPDRSAPKEITRAVEVRAGQDAPVNNVKLHSTARGAAGLQETPIVVDLRNPAVRAAVEQRIERAATPAQPVAQLAPAGTRGTTRRIEFDVPEVHIVNRTQQWVFIPNPEKMSPRPEAQAAQ